MNADLDWFDLHAQRTTKHTVFPRMIAGGDYSFFAKNVVIIRGRRLFEGGLKYFVLFSHQKIIASNKQNIGFFKSVPNLVP